MCHDLAGSLELVVLYHCEDVQRRHPGGARPRLRLGKSIASGWCQSQVGGGPLGRVSALQKESCSTDACKYLLCKPGAPRTIRRRTTFSHHLCFLCLRGARLLTGGGPWPLSRSPQHGVL
jgi:hypothetical protein